MGRRQGAIERVVRRAWADEVAAARGWVERIAAALAATLPARFLPRPRRRNIVAGGPKPHVFDVSPRRPARKRPSASKRRRPAARQASAPPRA